KANDMKQMHAAELYEFRHIYKGNCDYSSFFADCRVASRKCPTQIFFTRLKQAISKTSFREIRFVNMLLDDNYVKEIGRALEGKTAQTVHFFRAKLTDFIEDHLILAALVYKVRPQSLILAECDPRDAPRLLNERFLDNFVRSGWDHYSLRVEVDRVKTIILI
ncbi:hypothetical protein PFISCL1PPCAC_18223, partial [Pristionchus fissidentatus]